MSDAKELLAKLQADIRKQEEETAGDKRFANRLAEKLGLPPVYAIVEATETSVPLSIQADQFYGQPLAGAIRTILEMRKALKQGPASLNDIYSALVAGGYKFETKNEENSKRGLRQSLTKNVGTFHKLPNGLFGLTDWYPKIKRKGSDQAAPASGDDEQETKGGDE